jgi:tetratricopeptide (TPR) repeat protein
MMILPYFKRGAVCAALFMLNASTAVADDAPSPQLANPERAAELLPDAVVLVSKLYAEGKYDAARPLLAQLMLAPVPNLQVLFLSAQLAERDGDLARAAALYRDMLNRDPNLIRPRLELGRVLFKAGDYDGANYHFERVLASPLPPSVVANVEKFIKRMREQEGYFNLSVSLTPDSNANQGASSRQVVIQGLTYTLSDNTKPRSTLGVDVLMNARRNFGHDRKSFVRGYVDYQDFPNSTYDFSYLLGYVGRNFDVGSHTLTLEGGYQQAYSQHVSLYNGWALRAADYVRLKPNLGVEVALDSRRFDYNRANALYTGTRTTLSTTAAYSPDTASQWRGGVSVTRTTAQIDPYANSGLGLQLEHYRELPWQSLSSGTRLYLSGTRYDTTDPFWGVQRSDRNARVEFDLTKRDWNWKGFAPRITVGVVRNQSNIALYDYVRGYMRITASRDF